MYTREDLPHDYLKEGEVGRLDSVKIGTWPTPELPVVRAIEEQDIALLRDINDVFEKHGLTGKLARVEFDCGMEPQKPPRAICYRVCIPGPDDRPYCIWVCS